MFRSVSDDAGVAPTSVMGAPFGTTRRRTRSQAALEINERRERLKRTRVAMESMAQVRRGQASPIRLTPTHAAMTTPPRAKIIIGASFGENLTVETTPTKRDMQSPPQLRRVSAPPQVAVPTPEKFAIKDANVGAIVTNPAVASVPKARSRLPTRGIAQSSSSGPHGSTRKRMISFSPERAERPINEEAARQKQKRNLKASENLQLRLEGIPVRTPEKPTVPSVGGKPTPERCEPNATNANTATNANANANSPTTASNSVAATVVPSPLRQRCESPPTKPSSQTLELEGANSADANVDRVPTIMAKKELHFPDTDVKMATEEPPSLSQEDDPAPLSQDIDKENNQPLTTIGFGSSTSEPFTSTSVIEDVGLFNCDADVEFTGGVYGEGTDGKVSAATVRGQKVALKRAKPHDGFPEDEAKRRSAVELHYLRKVRHAPGFVQCLGLCDGIEHTCIALEVMDCKLSDYLRRHGTPTPTVGANTVSNGAKRSTSRRTKCYTLGRVATKAMLRQICEPMAMLHDQVNVAHGDLACRNILLRLPPKGLEQTWEPVVKLSDFGRIKTPTSEPPIFADRFSFFKNADVGCFAREILYRFLVGEIVPTNCTETRNLHKHLQDTVVEKIPDAAKEKLGPYYRLFMRCAGWGVRPTFREIVDHLDDLEYFETSDNGLFPLKPIGTTTSSSSGSSSSIGALESASFLSPMMEGGRNKMPSSGSKQQAANANKYDTPTTANATPRGSQPGNAPGRLLSNKSMSDLAASTKAPKPVNWLKARSVHPGHPVSKLHGRPSSATASTNPVTGSLTPIGLAGLPKKTPPSAGASRRSLQILNQIQHRQQEKKAAK